MPSRGKIHGHGIVSASSRVTKTAVRRAGSRNSPPLSTTAQEHLEQLARQVNSANVVGNDQHLGNDPMGDADDDGDIDAAVGKHEDGSIHLSANMLANGGTIASLQSTIDQALSAENQGSHGHDVFPLDEALATSSENPNRPPLRPHLTRTAAEVAIAAFGDSVKIDSALCKKLAGDAALREPTQRRQDQKLNIERRSNVEALLAHVTGDQPLRPCKNCHKGHGPWTQCIVYDGQMCGSCTNCWFNASGSRCTFHENNNPHSQAIYAPVPSAPVAPLAMMSYHPPPIIQTTPAANIPVTPLTGDMTQWGMSDHARRMVNQAMGDGQTYSRRHRFIERIEAAAKELGMRMAEYDEYLRTPEGMAEQLARDGEEQSQTRDESIDGLPSGDDAMV